MTTRLRFESPSAPNYSDHPASRRNIAETILLPLFILLMVLAPVFLPAIITAGHVALRTNRPATRLGLLRPATA